VVKALKSAVRALIIRPMFLYIVLVDFGKLFKNSAQVAC
jgi:hypothetical protein